MLDKDGEYGDTPQSIEGWKERAARRLGAAAEKVKESWNPVRNTDKTPESCGLVKESVSMKGQHPATNG